MKVIYKVIFVLVTGLASQLCAAQTPNQAAQSLSSLLAEMSSMKASITKLELDANGREVNENRIELLFRKPDHVVWRTVAPYEQIMVADGVKTWTYEPDLDQLSINDYPTDPSQNPVILLSANAATLQEKYDITRSMAGELERYELIPKDVDAQFIRLTISFRERVMAEMHFEGTYGDKMNLSFNEVEMNIELPDSHFVLDVPEGTEVLDNTAY